MSLLPAGKQKLCRRGTLQRSPLQAPMPGWGATCLIMGMRSPSLVLSVQIMSVAAI